MNLLTVEGLVLRFADRLILDHIDLSIHSKDKIGVIGINGSGKSSLLKVLAGELVADQAEIMKKRDLTIEYLAQDRSFDGSLTVLEAALLGNSPRLSTYHQYHEAERSIAKDPENETVLKRFYQLGQKMEEQNAWTIESEVKSALTQLGMLDFDKRIEACSGGEIKRVALASSLIQEAELLILDEPTNHLDPVAIVWLENYLKQYKGALLMVTHDRYFLERVTNVMVEIDRQKLYRYEANYAKWLEMKAERIALEEAGWEKQQNLYRQELAWMRQGAKARSTKQKARIKRFEALDQMEAPGSQENISVDTLSARLGKKTIELIDVSMAYGARTLFTDFSYLLARDDRLGLIGPNGSGKTTLLNIFADRSKPISGSREIGSTVKIAYFTQTQEEMDPNKRVIEYIREEAEIVQTKAGHLSATQMLERFLFDSQLQGSLIGKLSGGEKRRLYLLKILMQQPNVLLLDEPTNDLDITTLSVLEDYLDDFPGAVITVSHDRYFLDRVVDHLFAFKGDGEIVHVDGDISSYIEEVSNFENGKVKLSEEKKELGQKPKATKKIKLTMAEMHEIESIDELVASLEAKLEGIQAEIERSSTDYIKLQTLADEEALLSKDYEQALERWMYLNEKVEAIKEQEL